VETRPAPSPTASARRLPCRPAARATKQQPVGAQRPAPRLLLPGRSSHLAPRGLTAANGQLSSAVASRSTTALVSERSPGRRERLRRWRAAHRGSERRVQISRSPLARTRNVAKAMAGASTPRDANAIAPSCSSALAKTWRFGSPALAPADASSVAEGEGSSAVA
jgi:hypothetical protein